MIAQISAVKIDAESGNLMENSMSDGKTVAHATEFPSRKQTKNKRKVDKYITFLDVESTQ